MGKGMVDKKWSYKEIWLICAVHLTLQRRLLWFMYDDSLAIFSYKSFWIFLCYAAAS